MIRTKATLFVIHRRTSRAFSYNSEWELIEHLIFANMIPKHRKMQAFWKPYWGVPLWALGIRDTEFDGYWL